jgi:TetR/AcrR family transcriptional repressor of bet genes
MPLVVDHEVRRREVAEIAYGLIVQGSTDAATVRNVAATAGYSTNIVSHYFAGKKDLLQATFDLSLASSWELLVGAINTGDLQQALEALLPIHDVQRHNWRVWFAFWGAAVADQDFAGQQAEQIQNFRLILRNFYRDSGFCPASLSVEEMDDLARATVSVIIGLATQASFDPQDWPAAKQRKVISDHINFLKSQMAS